jgi:hypothetical protein
MWIAWGDAEMHKDIQSEYLKGRDYLGSLEVDNIILKCVLKK